MARREERAIWSRLVVAGVLTLAVAPTLPLLMTALVQPPGHPVWTRSFAAAIFSSARVGVGVAGLSLVLGLPLGLLAALYRFPGRSALVTAQALPLLLPSFLPAIGWSNLAAASWFPEFLSPAGSVGSVFVLGFQAIPLVFFATWAATGTLTASEIDAARLGGGEKAVLGCSAAACVPVAVLTALLAGILGLSDPGAPLILGGRSAVVEIRTTFSALYDYDLAGRQCLALGGLVLLVAAPIVILGLRRLAAAVLARQTRARTAYAHPVFGPIAAAALVVVLWVGIVMPTLGLCLPVIDRPMAGRALAKAWDTAGSTLAYTAGAGGIAVLLAVGLALTTRNKPRLRLVVLGVLLMLLAMPAALGAIGVSRAAATAPPELDWLVRSRFTVAAVLGLRFLPVAAVVLMRAVDRLSPSWFDAAKVHGVGRVRLFLRVLLPVLTPAILVGFLLGTVLAATDVTTTHLLQPPGAPSLPVAIFTVMANSPEGLVGSLCLLYLGGVVVLMIAAGQLPRWTSRRTPWRRPWRTQ